MHELSRNYSLLQLPEAQTNAVVGSNDDAITQRALTPAPFPPGLPDRGCSRWTAQRKALVAIAVQNGVIRYEDARVAYGLSCEELNGWVLRFRRYGLGGLKVTRRPFVRARPGLLAAS